ncbi:hypothetical protein E2C01_031139 [Portunus trituberculatus]|uniref:Uncharacterized protein n=1 Tax=Portunus trituberculatus TaxID=210409 RepID=A0A5B7EXT3_PORTR|nr:hypothetical protein [Portunus trituberculatus]
MSCCSDVHRHSEAVVMMWMWRHSAASTVVQVTCKAAGTGQAPGGHQALDRLQAAGVTATIPSSFYGLSVLVQISDTLTCSCLFYQC